MHTNEELQGAGVVSRRCGVTPDTLMNRAERGTMPKPIKINNRNYWKRSEVDAVVAGEWKPEPETA